MKNSTPVHSVVLTAVGLFLVFALPGCPSRQEKRDSFFNHGAALYEAAQYEEAVVELKNAVQLDPRFVKGYLYLGRAYLELGAVKHARGSLSKALELAPDLDDVRLYLSWMLVNAQRGDKALEMISPLLQKDPAHPGALYIAGRASLLVGKPEEALKLLNKIDRSKRDKYVLRTFADAYKKLGNTQKVKEYLLQCQEVAPDDPASYLELSKIYTGGGQLDKAEDELRKLIKEKKGETAYSLLLCEFLLNAGRDKKAEMEFERLIADNPRDTTCMVAYSKYLVDKKKFGQAQVLLREGVRNAAKSWQVRNALVEAYVADGKMTQALREVDLFLQSHPTDSEVDAQVKKGQILAKLNRWKEAEKQSDTALALEPTSPAARLLKGNVLVHKGHFDEAIVQLRQAVDTKPSESQGHLLLAEALSLSGELSLAVEQLKAGLKISPQDAALRKALITYYQQEKEWEYALEEADAGLKQQPQDSFFLIQKGRILTAQGKLDQAEKVFNAMIDNHPENDMGYVELGKLKRAAGDDAGAIALFEKALQLKGDKAAPLKLLIETYLETKQEEKAAALCTTMLEEDPANALAAAALGDLCLRRGNYQTAEKQFQQAIDASPYWEEPYHGLLRVYAMTNRLHEAQDNLKEIYAQDPASFRIGFTLALVDENLGEYDRAIALAEALMARYPHVVATNRLLARLYANHFQDSKTLNKALAYARRALAETPDNPQVLDTLAWIEFRLGRIHKALNYVTRAVNGAGKDPMMNYHAGVVSAKAGDSVAARKYLSKAIELGLTDDYAKESEHLLKTL